MGLDLINELKRKKGLTNETLSEQSGVPLGTLAKITSGITKDPKFETLKALANVLGCSVADFADEPKRDISPDEREVLASYRSLDQYGKDLVTLVMRAERARYENEFPDEIEPAYLREYLTPAAAGAASPALGDDYVLIPKTPDVPEQADFAVRISGDSMEPYIQDGDRVYVVRDAQLRDGDVGIFFADGDMKCKQYCEDPDGNIYLLSLNRKRSDMDLCVLADSGLTVFCFGKVILDRRPPLPPA